MSILIFCTIFILWLFCALGTFAKINRVSLKCIFQQITERFFSIMGFNDLLANVYSTEFAPQKIKQPLWRDSILQGRENISREIVEHYMTCNQACLADKPFIKQLTNHYHYTCKLLNYICSVPHLISKEKIMQCQFIYIEPTEIRSTGRESATSFYDFELCILAKDLPGNAQIVTEDKTVTCTTESEFIFRPGTKRIYQNLGSAPCILIRISYVLSEENGGLMNHNSSQPITDFIARLKRWTAKK